MFESLERIANDRSALYAEVYVIGIEEGAGASLVLGEVGGSDGRDRFKFALMAGRIGGHEFHAGVLEEVDGAKLIFAREALGDVEAAVSNVSGNSSEEILESLHVVIAVMIVEVVLEFKFGIPSRFTAALELTAIIE